MHIAVLHYFKVWLFVSFALVLCGLEANVDAHADGGSAQAIMSLFVPPNDANMAFQKNPNGLPAGAVSYDPDTHISVKQQSGNGITYEVWMEL